MLLSAEYRLEQSKRWTLVPEPTRYSTYEGLDAIPERAFDVLMINYFHHRGYYMEGTTIRYTDFDPFWVVLMHVTKACRTSALNLFNWTKKTRSSVFGLLPKQKPIGGVFPDYKFKIDERDYVIDGDRMNFIQTKPYTNIYTWKHLWNCMSSPKVYEMSNNLRRFFAVTCVQEILFRVLSHFKNGGYGWLLPEVTQYFIFSYDNPEIRLPEAPFGHFFGDALRIDNKNFTSLVMGEYLFYFWTEQFAKEKSSHYDTKYGYIEDELYRLTSAVVRPDSLDGKYKEPAVTSTVPFERMAYHFKPAMKKMMQCDYNKRDLFEMMAPFLYHLGFLIPMADISRWGDYCSHSTRYRTRPFAEFGSSVLAKSKNIKKHLKIEFETLCEEFRPNYAKKNRIDERDDLRIDEITYNDDYDEMTRVYGVCDFRGLLKKDLMDDFMRRKLKYDALVRKMGWTPKDYAYFNIVKLRVNPYCICGFRATTVRTKWLHQDRCYIYKNLLDASICMCGMRFPMSCNHIPSCKSFLKQKCGLRDGNCEKHKVECMDYLNTLKTASKAFEQLVEDPISYEERFVCVSCNHKSATAKEHLAHNGSCGPFGSQGENLGKCIQVMVQRLTSLQIQI